MIDRVRYDLAVSALMQSPLMARGTFREGDWPGTEHLAPYRRASLLCDAPAPEAPDVLRQAGEVALQAGITLWALPFDDGSVRIELSVSMPLPQVREAA